MNRLFAFLGWALCAVSAAARAESASTPLPPLAHAPTTLEEIRVPRHRVDAPTRWDPRKRGHVLRMKALGYGDYETRAGEARADLTLDGSVPPPPGPNATRLARFLHLADVQLADDESPLRVAELDSAELSSAFRPQEGHGCHLLNAAIRTANALHSRDPLDLVMLGGDNIDNAQTNELAWFRAILAGAPSVECDSGRDNSSLLGDPLYPKVPFAPVGLDVPWLWVTGNHDILVQGNFPVAKKLQKEAVGSVSKLGTRVWELPGGPVVAGLVQSDPGRALLTRRELLASVSSDGDGHGIDASVLERTKANYTKDVGSVRFIVVDTAAETGGSQGVVLQGDIESFLRPALDAARNESKWVVIVSHHASASLADGAVPGGTRQEGTVSASDWRALIGGYPNVLMHLAGHSHEHKIEKVPYWEVRTSALADYPHQMRLLEIHDQDNGYLTVSGVAIDVATEGDPLAEAALSLGVLDLTSGWIGDGSGERKDRNVRLWIRKR